MRQEKYLKKDDDERRKWALALYGIDTNDCKLYDVVFHIDTLKVDDVVDLLEETVKRPCFQPTDLSRKILEYRYIESRIVAKLVDEYPQITTSYDNGKAYISLKANPHKEDVIKKNIQEILKKDKMLKDIDFEVHITPTKKGIYPRLKVWVRFP